MDAINASFSTECNAVYLKHRLFGKGNCGWLGGRRLGQTSQLLSFGVMASPSDWPRNIGCIEDLEKYCMDKWPQWAKNRYWCSAPQSGNLGVLIRPTPDECVDMLWLVAAIKKNRERSKYVQFHREAVVKGLVEGLGLSPVRKVNSSVMLPLKDAHSPGCQTGLSKCLLPKVALSMAYIGGSPMWSHEMAAICAQISEMPWDSLRQVEDLVNALRITRHWTESLVILEESANFCLLKEMETDLSSKSSLTASHAAHGMAFLGHAPCTLSCTLVEMLKKQWHWKSALVFSSSLSMSLCIDHEGDVEKVDLLKQCNDDFLYALLQSHHTLDLESRDIFRLYPYLLVNEVQNNPFLSTISKHYKPLLELARDEWSKVHDNSPRTVRH